MSKLNELIQELSPNGIEYKFLNEIAHYARGRINVSEINQETYVGVENLLPNKAGKTTARYVPTEGNVMAFHVDDILIGNIRPYLRKIWLADCDGGTNGDVLVVQLNGIVRILPKFLYYVMSSEDFFSYDVQNSKGAKMPRGDKDAVLKYKVPVPPLEIQYEIVRILDNFTELTTELTTELKARQKQYEYYRDKLLTFESSVRKYVLGDIATVTKLAGFEFTKYVTYSDKGNIIALRGINVKNGKLNLKDIKYIDQSELSKLTRSKLHVGDMLFTYVGTIGEVALINEEEKYYLAPNVALIRPNKKVILPEFMRYYFQSRYFVERQINRLLQSSSMQNIPMEKIRKFELCIPPIAVQKCIVNVLDKFDTICSDLNIGLPAEIEARQKQYEYYRDKLLTFKELSE